MNDTLFSVLIGLLAVCLMALGCRAGIDIGESSKNTDWKEWTVDTGRAEFYLDDTHQKVWRWKEQP